MAAAAALSLTGLLSLALLLNAAFSLELHFYRKSCPRAELIVKTVVQQHVGKDPTLAPAILRLFFHDCFVRGCDASILIDSADGNAAEKEAPPNLTVRGYEVIDAAKAALEKACPGTVSCADVLAIAARDSVKLSGGAAYALGTGRRDGTVSNKSEVHLLGPSATLLEAVVAFQGINLTARDLVTLLGAHAIGTCHCAFFVDRLYNFQGSGAADPSMDPGVVAALRRKCPEGAVVTAQNITSDQAVFMNQATATPFTLDSSFFRGVLGGKAVLQLDQGLASGDLTGSLAARYLSSPKLFLREFSKAMGKLGTVGILEGDQGEIRLNCRRVNKS